MNVGVVGTGYVGLVAGACFASTGNHVICVDIDEDKVRRLKDGEIPIYEPGLEDLVQEGIEKERLQFTTELDAAVKASEVIFIAVGTPPDEDGSADLRHVLAVAEGIGKSMDGYKIIVDKSTVPVGTAGLVSDRIKEHTDHDFSVVSNPEFLKEGDAVNDFLKPERVIIGADDDRGHEALKRLYQPFMMKTNRIIHMDVVSAELTKYTANAFLATRISFMNEIARLCERTGADIDMVRQGIGTDSRIGPAFLYAGAGYGGSCFPKDVQAILRTSNQYGVDLQIIEATERVNAEQKKILFSKIARHYNSDLTGKTFAIWGLSFKPRTDDMREAPAIVLINSLLAAGANVRAFDPEAMEVSKAIFGDTVTLCEDEYQTAEGADALILVTEWNDFRTPDFEKLSGMIADKVIFDGRNIWDPTYVMSFGFDYYGIGPQERLELEKRVNLTDTYRQQLDAHRAVVEQMTALEGDVVRAVELVTACFRDGSKVMLAGNGGSAADAQHWAAEWVIRLNPTLDRPGMAAIALSTDTSILSAGANDLGYDRVFARQVEALGRKGDLLLAISTSGNSANLIEAVAAARQHNMTVLGLLGRDGGRLAPLCDHAVIVPSDDTQRIQEMHGFIGHLLCMGSEEALYGE